MWVPLALPAPLVAWGLRGQLARRVFRAILARLVPRGRRVFRVVLGLRVRLVLLRLCRGRLVLLARRVLPGLLVLIQLFPVLPGLLVPLGLLALLARLVRRVPWGLPAQLAQVPGLLAAI
jgi:hypothetical protein